MFRTCTINQYITVVKVFLREREVSPRISGGGGGISVELRTMAINKSTGLVFLPAYTSGLGIIM